MTIKYTKFHCPHCKGHFHNIKIEAKDQNHVLTGADFIVAGVASKHHWSTFTEQEHIKGDNLICPECEQTYGHPSTGVYIGG